MKVSVREYAEMDKPYLIKCMEGLQDYLILINPMQRLKRLSEYGVSYTNRLIDKVEQNEGIIYVAEVEHKIVGCIAGIIELQEDDNLLECVPSKTGRIIELYVDSNCRNQNIGSLLMKKIEEHFKQMNCDVSRVEVFEPNVGAYNFYHKFDYNDRVIDLIKKL